MKKTGFFAGLNKSTRMTVIGCACFLGMSAAIIVFLMLCPIEPKTRSMEVSLPSGTSASEDGSSAQATERETRQQEGPTEKRPLSTWGVTFESSVFNRDEYYSPNNTDETIDMEDLPIGEDPTEPPQQYTEGDTTQIETGSGNDNTEASSPATEPGTENDPITTDPPEIPETDPPVAPDPTDAPVDSAAGSI